MVGYWQLSEGAENTLALTRKPLWHLKNEQQAWNMLLERLIKMADGVRYTTNLEDLL